MDRNPIPFPVPIMSHSISLNFLILPDGEVVLVPPRRATIIPIDRKPATENSPVTEMLATERRSEIILRALKAAPKDAISGFFEARKQRRRITLDEALAGVRFLSAVTRECGHEGVRIDQVLNLGDSFRRRGGFQRLRWLFTLAAIVERARTAGGVLPGADVRKFEPAAHNSLACVPKQSDEWTCAEAQKGIRNENMTKPGASTTATVAEQGAPVAPEKSSSKKGPAQKRGAPQGPKAAKGAKPAKKGKATKKAKPAKKPADKGERTNKKAEVIAMMKRAKGVTLAEIIAATGWQKHTIRGFVSLLGSKGGETIESSKNAAGDRTYRIAK